MNVFFQRRFFPYFATQFLGAFNDNVFKNALIIIFTYHLVVSSSGMLVNLAAILFILPFFLFSPLAGQLADKYEKSTLIRKIKNLEILIMLLGAIGVYLQSTIWMLVVLFLMGMQSTFFGPIKYSILPQQLSKEELLGGNAIVEAGTFLAILLGTVLGASIAGEGNYPFKVTVAILFFALLGRLASHFITSSPAAQTSLQIDYNPITAGRMLFSGLRENRANFLIAVGISWFWFYGAIFLTQFPGFAKDVLQGTPYVATLLMAMFSIGIGLGSFLCSVMAGRRVELGIVPIGALGMTLSGLYVGCADINIPGSIDFMTIQDVLTNSSTLKVLIALLLLAVSGGLFVVPLYAALQTNSPTKILSRNIAALNILNALFMVIAGAFAILCFALGHSIQTLFIVVALMNIAVSLFIFLRVPEFIMRMAAWLLVHSLYRIDKYDLHHIPKQGPAVIAANHVSFVDPVLIAAISDRPIRFVMYYKIYELPIVHYLFKIMKAIPIASKQVNADLLNKAYDDIAEALENDELVCIFPEGGLTPDGEIQPFKHGLEKILQRSTVPVVPLALKGLWGTWFSRFGGRAMQGWPRNWMKKIEVTSGPLIESNYADLGLIEKNIRDLRGGHR